MTKYELYTPEVPGSEYEEKSVLIVGNGEEISQVYGSIYRNMEKTNSNFGQPFYGKYKFNRSRWYGLIFEPSGWYIMVSVLSASVCLAIMTDDETTVTKSSFPGLQFLED